MSKILFITPMWHEEATPHDAKVCNYFVDEWIKLGYEVVVIHYRSQFPEVYHKIAKVLPWLYQRICGDNTGLRKNIPEFEQQEAGYTVYSIPIYKYVPHGKLLDRTYIKQAKHLKTKLNEINYAPDVIIGHFCNPSLGIIKRLQQYYPKAKTSIVLHEKASTVKKIFGNDAELILNSVDSVGFRSASIKESVCSEFNLRNNLFMCYSGVASSFVGMSCPPKQWTDNSVNKFLYVGRLANYKHPEVIVEALAKLYPQKDFSLTFVGSNDNAFPITKKAVKETETMQQVAFLGQIKRDDIIDLYDKSDCFVMVSDNEVFGLVYLEAMSRGCITVAGDNGGMVGIIKHGVNGFLCKPGDVDALVSIIATINKMTLEEKSMMSDRAKQTVLDFTDKSVAEKYVSFVMSN